MLKREEAHLELGEKFCTFAVGQMEEVPATECFLLLFGDAGARNRPEAGKTKCFVIFSKCFVVFSKCFVVFTKCSVIFRSAAACIFLRRRMTIFRTQNVCEG